MKVRAIRRRNYPKVNGGKQFGNRCKSYAQGCPVCEAHRFKDTTGRFPYDYDELAPYLRGEK